MDEFQFSFSVCHIICNDRALEKIPSYPPPPFPLCNTLEFRSELQYIYKIYTNITLLLMFEMDVFHASE